MYVSIVDSWNRVTLFSSYIANYNGFNTMCNFKCWNLWRNNKKLSVWNMQNKMNKSEAPYKFLLLHLMYVQIVLRFCGTVFNQLPCHGSLPYELESYQIHSVVYISKIRYFLFLYSYFIILSHVSYLIDTHFYCCSCTDGMVLTC